jgi:ATP-dependent DNA helicase RecG
MLKRSMPSTSEVRGFLRRLDGERADAIESEVLECKPWDPHPRAHDSQVRDLRETVVAFANARGGTVVLGIADGKRTRHDAIQGVGQLDANDLRRRIYDGTEPHILVEVEELIEPEGRLLLVQVPRGLPPHTTSEGVGKIRVGKETKPLTGSTLSRLLFSGAQRDMTAETVPGATEADLDPEQIRTLRRTIEGEAENRGLAQLPTSELLRNLDLIRDGEVTFAAILLLGRSPALARWVPQHELIFLRFKSPTRYDVRHDLKGPLLILLDALQRIIEAQARVAAIASTGFRETTVPDLTWWVAREAVLNALVHRDYFLHQSVQVELHRDRLEVISPGGFVGGVEPTNILRHPPVRRNPLLANVLQTVGLVNRAGLGVDRIYDELLRLGKGMPRYSGDEAHVRLTLPISTHLPFASFVAEETRAGRQLELDDLIALRAVADRGHLDRWSAAQWLQSTEEDAAERLVSLRGRGYLVAQGRGRGTAYRLPRRLSDLIRGPGETDQDLPLDEEAVRLRVQAVLEERGRLTNAEVRRISGYSRTQAVRVMRDLVEQGLVTLVGRGRAAHYVGGPNAPLRGAATSKRRKE